MDIYFAWARSVEHADDTNTTRFIKSVARIYRQCATHMLAINEVQLAATCYRTGSDYLPDTTVALDMRLSLLPLLATGSAEQQALTQSLMQETNADKQQLEDIASAFLGMQKPELAFRIFARLALKDPENSQRWLQEAARWAEASGRLNDAVVFLESLASSTTSSPDDTLDSRIERLLLQAGQVRGALERMRKRIAQSPENVALLERGVTLAMQASEPRQALIWNTTRLSQGSNNAARLQLQSELAQAAGDTHLARTSAAQWLSADPENAQARRRLAQLSEWDGDLPSALKNWLWLADSKHGMPESERLEALREVVRIGDLGFQFGMAADALRTITLLEQATEKDIVRLVSLYQLDGRPDQASQALHDIISLQGPTPFIIRTLAMHEYANLEYTASLAAWDLFVDEYAQNTEATLARVELMWRLDLKDEAMQVASSLQGHTLIADASEYQIRVLAEIAWRERYYWLDTLLQPRIAALEDAEQRSLFERRRLGALRDAGEDELAMREALKLWGETGDSDFALLALNLAVKVDARPVIEQFSPGQRDARQLQKSTAYWNELAALRFKEGDAVGARKAYERALKLDPENTGSIASLLWLAISEEDEALLQASLARYSNVAQTVPGLWQPMAIGYLQLGGASQSLVWFDKLLDQIDSDYGMMLTYADALEYAGMAADARKVRQYTLQQLRPLLVDGTSSDEQSVLLRQFASLSSRYEGVEFNQELIDFLLESADSNAEDSAVNPSPVNASAAGDAAAQAGLDIDGQEESDLWRQDFAISWLMSTQQYDLARLVMARIHAKRLQAPAWQQLAIALKDKDDAALQAIVDTTGPLSVGNHILALRQLGNDTEAYSLAQQAIAPGAWLPGSAVGDRQIALEQYISLRDERPAFISGTFDGRSISGLDVVEQGVEYRQSLPNSRFGYSFTAYQRQLDSDLFELEGLDEQTDLSVSLYFNDRRQNGKLTAGFLSTEQGDLNYAAGAYSISTAGGRSELSAEIAYNEAIDFSPELTIAGAQNRITLGLDTAIGRQKFVRLSADATQINTRLQQQRVATGLGGSVEAGLRGAFGSNNWSTSVTASQQSYDRASVLPEELRLSNESSVNSVLVENVQRLSVGASLSRGGVNANFPQVTSPRYYLNSSIGQNWPERVVSFQIDAGAGFRVLGGDELSFSISHETQPITQSSGDATSIGLQYRYHFQ